MEEPGSLDVPPGMSVFMLFRSDHKKPANPRAVCESDNDDISIFTLCGV